MLEISAKVCYGGRMEGTTIQYKVFGKTGVLVHSRVDPTQHEWEEFITEITAGILEKKTKGLVVYSMGGAPRDNQRNQLMSLTRFHNTPTAVIVVDPSAIDAGGCLVQGLNWTGDLSEQTWTPAQLQDAIATVTDKDNAEVADALNQFHSTQPPEIN